MKAETLPNVGYVVMGQARRRLLEGPRDDGSADHLWRAARRRSLREPGPSGASLPIYAWVQAE